MHERTGWLVLAVMGCGVATSFTPTNMPPHAMQRRPVASVEMFLTSAPTRPFVEVGILGSSHASAYSVASDDQVILALRDKAAEIGCDAVVLQSESDTLVGSSTATTVTVETKKRFRAVCVMYRNAQATEASP